MTFGDFFSRQGSPSIPLFDVISVWDWGFDIRSTLTALPRYIQPGKNTNIFLSSRKHSPLALHYYFFTHYQTVTQSKTPYNLRRPKRIEPRAFFILTDAFIPCRFPPRCSWTITQATKKLLPYLFFLLTAKQIRIKLKVPAQKTNHALDRPLRRLFWSLKTEQ